MVWTPTTVCVDRTRLCSKASFSGSFGTFAGDCYTRGLEGGVFKIPECGSRNRHSGKPPPQRKTKDPGELGVRRCYTGSV